MTDDIRKRMQVKESDLVTPNAIAAGEDNVCQGYIDPNGAVLVDPTEADFINAVEKIKARKLVPPAQTMREALSGERYYPPADNKKWLYRFNKFFKNVLLKTFLV